MLAASSTFDMDLLAREQASRFVSKFQKIYYARSIIKWCFSDEPLAFALSRWMANRIDATARDLRDRKTWFQGATQFIEERTEADADADLDALIFVDRGFAQAKGLHEAIGRIIERRVKRGAKSVDIGRAIEHAHMCAAELVEALSNYRNALLRDVAARGTFAGHTGAIKYLENIDPQFAQLCVLGGEMQAKLEGFMSPQFNDVDESLLAEARLALESIRKEKQVV